MGETIDFFDLEEGCYVEAHLCDNGNYKLMAEYEIDKWVPYKEPFVTKERLKELQEANNTNISGIW